MPRRARIVAAGYPMHVILRGIDRAAVFFEDDARRFFLEALGVAAEEESGAVHPYVLMTNYTSHLLMTARRGAGVAAVMRRRTAVCATRQPDMSGRPRKETDAGQQGEPAL
jgi:putative transposase